MTPIQNCLAGWRSCCWTAALAAVLTCSSSAQAEPQGNQDVPLVPVLFTPIRLDRGIKAKEKLLRAWLSAGMIRSGKYAEAASGDTATQIQQCVKSVNRDDTAETCWIRVGQGQGAQMLVAGEVSGNAKTCSVTIKLVELELRVSPRQHVADLAPCTASALKEEMGRAARVLAGEPSNEQAPLPAAASPASRAIPGEARATTSAPPIVSPPAAATIPSHRAAEETAPAPEQLVVPPPTSAPIAAAPGARARDTEVTLSGTPPPPPAKQQAAEASASRWLGWSGVVLGVGLLGSGAYLHLRAEALAACIEEGCEGSGRKEPGYPGSQNDVEEVLRLGVWATALLGTGGVALVAGALLLLTDEEPRTAGEGKATATWIPLLLPGGLGLAGRF
ncbi:MAG: hypothetical protein FJ125_03170 [Deltaproteobacteria bacterium]|nr:hypothetical protein [Deltaproteobacteria bacterium]